MDPSSPDNGGPSGPSSSAPTDWAPRDSHVQGYWGDLHAVPERGTQERLNLFVRPQPMSESRKQDIVKAYQEAIKDSDPLTKAMSYNLRPSTPRRDRAEAIINDLRTDGENVDDHAEASIREHLRYNCGLIESLQHYSQGETHIPLEHANELVQMINRLMLEQATQMAAAEEERADIKKEYQLELKIALQEHEQEKHFLNERAENLEGQRNNLEARVESLKEQRDNLEARVEEFRTERDNLQDYVERLEMYWSSEVHKETDKFRDAQARAQQAEAKLEDSENRRQIAEAQAKYEAGKRIAQVARVSDGTFHAAQAARASEERTHAAQAARASEEAGYAAQAARMSEDRMYAAQAARVSEDKIHAEKPLPNRPSSSRSRLRPSLSLPMGSRKDVQLGSQSKADKKAKSKRGGFLSDLFGGRSTADRVQEEREAASGLREKAEELMSGSDRSGSEEGRHERFRDPEDILHTNYQDF